MITRGPKPATLLIHYGAPGTVKDDGKWKQIAKSVIDMKAIATIRVTNLPETESKTPTSYQRCQLRQPSISRLDEFASTEGSDPGAFLGFPDDFGIQEACVERRSIKRKRSVITGQPKQGLIKQSRVELDPANVRLKTVPAAHTTFARTKQGLNPPYKNPLITSKGKTTCDCECTQRRLTAPEATVLVPFSGTPRRKRWQSNSFISSDVFSSFEEHAQRPRRKSSTLTESNKQIDPSLKDNMRHCSPLQSYNELRGGSDYADEHRLFTVGTGVAEQAIGRRPQIHNVSGQFGSLISTNAICSASLNGTDKTPFRSSLSDYKSVTLLPLRVECDIPMHQMDDVTAFSIPRHLDQLANRECLRHRFHPTIVERDIKSTERGYWRLLIKLSSPDIVAASRFPPLPTSQSSDIQYLLRREGKISRYTSKAETDAMVREMLCRDLANAQNMLWTQGEFLRFFDALRSFVRGGSAGWATRVVLLRGEQLADEIEIELRIYTFGQIIAHMWLALSGLSDGLTDQVPLEWIGSERRSIVRMAGKKEQHGNFGYWECKQDGKAGFWGIRRNQSPIGVGCD